MINFTCLNLHKIITLKHHNYNTIKFIKSNPNIFQLNIKKNPNTLNNNYHIFNKQLINHNIKLNHILNQMLINNNINKYNMFINLNTNNINNHNMFNLSLSLWFNLST